MSFNGYWFVTLASDEQIRAWRERYADEFAKSTPRRAEAMAWWTNLGDDAFLEPDDRGGWQMTEASRGFVDLFWDAVSDELVDEVLEVVSEVGESGYCCPGVRKAAPAAAFYNALGVGPAARMPGCLGEFLITAEEAAAALPEVEQILADTRREELIERVGRWLGEGEMDDPVEIVDGVLRVFREAVARGLGIAALSASF